MTERIKMMLKTNKKITMVEDDEMIPETFSDRIDIEELPYDFSFYTTNKCFSLLKHDISKNKVEKQDLWILDLIISEHNGIDVFHLLQKNDLGRKFCFLTGCSEDDKLYREAEDIASTSKSIKIFTKPTQLQEMLDFLEA